MPVRTDRRERRGRAPGLWSLGMLVLPAVLGFAACAKDYCKIDQSQPRELLCKCQPKDDELMARLQPTELPYPVRKVVLRCAGDLRRTSVPSLVTKQGLHDCVSADTSLDAKTRDSVVALIDRSSLIDQKNLQDREALCQAAPSGAATAPAAPADPAAAATPATPAAPPPATPVANTPPIIAPPPSR